VTPIISFYVPKNKGKWKKMGEKVAIGNQENWLWKFAFYDIKYNRICYTIRGKNE